MTSEVSSTGPWVADGGQQLMDSPAFVPPGFHIRYRLGSGQTSNVHLAMHATLGTVALKLPRPEVQDKPLLRRMFENEVQITLRLKHPNIVAGLAGSPTGPSAFLALEYCAGGTLDQHLLTHGADNLDRSVRLIHNVAAGLEQTHLQQVLHRDVKPANVFLTEGMTAKLGDFGTGCFIKEDNRDRVGTAFYMAPEIFEGETATYASDVYSLGILAYEVLTGHRPFTGETYEQVMHAHTSGLPRPIESYRKDFPRALSQVISRAMSREASRRYQVVKDFLAEFEQASGLTIEAPEVELTGRASRQKQAEPDDARKGRSKGFLSGLFRRKA